MLCLSPRIISTKNTHFFRKLNKQNYTTKRICRFDNTLQLKRVSEGGFINDLISSKN